jgi:hypothetical protein
MSAKLAPTATLLDITLVAFKGLPLRSYATMPAPSPPFKTISELVLWNGLLSWHRITPDVIDVIKMPSFLRVYFLYLHEQKKKSHWGLDPVKREPKTASHQYRNVWMGCIREASGRKSHPGHPLSWLRLFVFYSLSTKMQKYLPASHICSLPHPFQSILHYRRIIRRSMVSVADRKL